MTADELEALIAKASPGRVLAYVTRLQPTAPQDDLVERLRALHVWPQFVADEHACDLRSKQLEGLYGVGTVAHEAADRIETLIAERDAALAKLAKRSDWFAGDVDCDGEPLTTIPTHEYNRLVTDCEKFRDQARDTCTRAETAEAKLAAHKALEIQP